jgi:hypothetical protein
MLPNQSCMLKKQQHINNSPDQVSMITYVSVTVSKQLWLLKIVKGTCGSIIVKTLLNEKSMSKS